MVATLAAMNALPVPLGYQGLTSNHFQMSGLGD
jgi:hypothetical protein